MKKTATFLIVLVSIISAGCAITQKPAAVLDGDAISAVPVQTEKATVYSSASQVERKDPDVLSRVDVMSKALGLADLGQIAKTITKSPLTAKKYAGQTLKGKAKFVKAPKANPNAVVADVRVAGLGEVSLWCRNVVGAAPAGRVMTFEGTLTGSVYTSEDFSHDVTMKDCRFHE